MTEQQMPARIWCRELVSGCGHWAKDNEPSYDECFIRADIAERMAEALRIARASIWSGGDTLVASTAIDAALSAFKDSAKDGGAS